MDEESATWKMDQRSANRETNVQIARHPFSIEGLHQLCQDGRKCRINPIFWTIGNSYVLMATYKGVPTKIFSLSPGFLSGNHGAGSGPYAKRFATNSNSCDGPLARIVASWTAISVA